MLQLKFVKPCRYSGSEVESSRKVRRYLINLKILWCKLKARRLMRFSDAKDESRSNLTRVRDGEMGN
jgi:hypothetical protein